MCRPLNLLATANTLFSFFAGGGTDVVIECGDQAGVARVPHYFGTVRVVSPQNGIVVEEVHFQISQSVGSKLKPVARQGRRIPKNSGILHGHRAGFPVDPLPSGVTPIPVAPG